MKHVFYTLVALLIGVAVASDSQAFWGHRFAGHGSYASAGCYGCYGGYTTVSYAPASCYGCYGGSSMVPAGCYGGSGLFPHLRAKIANHRAQRLAHRTAYRGAGCYGCYGGCYGVSYSSCYGCYGGCYSGCYGTSYSTPAIYSDPVIESSVDDCGCAQTETSADFYAQNVSATTGNGLLRVEVPTDAKVYINGNLTTSTGTHRQYVSNGLKSGQSYSYDVRVEYTREGKSITESKHVTLGVGSDEMLAFSGSQPTETIATKLELRVPSNARVTLAGVATQQTGEVREYVTTRLPAGETWSDYTVMVELDVNGQTLKQEKTINLQAGDSQELAFDFDTSAKLALRD